MASPAVILVILDGFGDRAAAEDNAVRLASTPHLDALFTKFPHTVIATSGADVGLPPGQMGNSEVGHLNLGAGRVAMMELSRIDLAVFDRTLGQSGPLADAIDAAKRTGSKLHLMGLLSDGGVHSSIEHVFALIDTAKAQHVSVVVHAFLDGRDVQPKTASRYLAALELRLAGVGQIGSVSGRYYAMDRDNRWERVEAAYRAIVVGEGRRYASALDGFQASVAAGVTDEFVVPYVVGDYAGLRPGDAGIHANFRPDRARELVSALATDGFENFPRAPRRPFDVFTCMTQYDSTFGLPVAFAKEEYPDTLGAVLAGAKLKQFRCAETEKYAHITYFFNGSREAPFDGERRALVPSPKDVATYDLKPEMSAAEVTHEVTTAIRSKEYAFILVNFANPDMVGHTGILAAAIRAVEAVDTAVGALVAAAAEAGATVMVTADHGNCELMRDPATGAPHTSHTTFPVPLVLAGFACNPHEVPPRVALRAGGRLADVAPTILALLGLAKPDSMSGTSLLETAQGTVQAPTQG